MHTEGRADYMGSSVNKRLVSFRAMVGYAYEDGLHNNDRALGCFSKRKVEESDKAAEIYLTVCEKALGYFFRVLCLPTLSFRYLKMSGQ